MIKTNKDKLPIKPLIGQVSHVGLQNFMTMTMDPDGKGQYRVSTGGITYNFKLGDNCMDIVGAHIEPGVTTVFGGVGSPGPFGPPEGTAYSQLACVGNEAFILGGPLDGTKGYVIGKISGHGVTLGFDSEVIQKMNGTERFFIRALGVGLAIEGADEKIMIHNIDPSVLEAMNIKEDGGKYYIPVKKILPGHLVGAGVGGGVVAGSGQIMTDDGPINKEYGLDDLCFGDFIAFTDIDMTSGRTFREGAVAVCQIVSGDCLSLGAGPHIMTVAASMDGTVVPVIDENANLANILDLK